MNDNSTKKHLFQNMDNFRHVSRDWVNHVLDNGNPHLTSKVMGHSLTKYMISILHALQKAHVGLNSIKPITLVVVYLRLSKGVGQEL